MLVQATFLSFFVLQIASAFQISNSNWKIQTGLKRFQPLKMAVYSSQDGVPAALVEERDACGVGFIASLNNKKSHSVLQQALVACNCMEHRGATSADNISGDGAGVMTAIPWGLFSKIVPNPSSVQNKDGSIATAVGMVFLPRDDQHYLAAVKKVEKTLKENGLILKGWREVPVNGAVLGRLSADFVPRIKQMIVQPDPSSICNTSEEFEIKLYETRRLLQGYFRAIKSKDAYVCSFSSKTIVYKGMLRSCDLPKFYLDLDDPNYETNFAVYHRRFSTNTVPKWFLAQPMRLLAHNGEINTLLGNINWVKSRQHEIKLADGIPLDSDITVKGPLVDVGRSDSANLDSVLESYVRHGYSPEEALMILVPEAFESQPKIQNNKELQDFYKYYESIQEAWDGPALLVFADGNVIGAALDRNGLRPARYMVTSDENGERLVHMMSEVGVTKILDQFGAESTGSKVKLLDSGRLGPGEMLSVDLKTGQFNLNDPLKTSMAKKKPYSEMLSQSVKNVPKSSFRKDVEKFIETTYNEEDKKKALAVPPEDTAPVAVTLDHEKLIRSQSLFGWGTEDVEVQIASMAADGQEATICMGDDAPLACLSAFPHTLYDYFKQRFAQVTNPPIDPLREGAVMSLAMFVGPRGDPLNQQVQPGVRVKIESPVLNSEELKQIESTQGLSFQTISTLYPLKDSLQSGGLKAKLDEICAKAVEAVKSGCNVIHLSDELPSENSEAWKSTTYIPPLLAVGAVHHTLINLGLRAQASILVSTAQAWSPHHIACLVGYGATGVVPYAAYNSVINWHGQKRIQLAMNRGDIPKISAEKALYNFRKAIDKGLMKILSKMGISLLSSYHSAQIFEALGLSDDVVKFAFKGTSSRISGLTFDEIANEVALFSRVTFGNNTIENILKPDLNSTFTEGGDSALKKLFNYGFLNFLKSGEYHHNNQPLIKTLHQSLKQKDINIFQLYEQAVKSRPPTTLRDTLQFIPTEESGRKPVPLEEVESIESILQRFVTGGMSLGALSREAHETLAISMNRIGAKSNSGEGGEDPVRMLPIYDVDETTGKSTSFPHLHGLKNGDIASSKVKQIASGRFGVTPQYLMSASQLEIKMAQGAKPGEGGQLPGPKIDDYIATLRKSKPGVTLISPPPHHDIYSIEDLAQLIHDLHQINPKAPVSVKLVSEEGIGTVASGVAKAGADIIQISGHDGGTGASPATSVKHAGSPWELGLVESHSTLRKNALRDRVLLRVDGGLKTGWDVVMAAAMGAEEYGFGTVALIAEGCIMARICHTNKCPVGITSQLEALRKKFAGTPDNVVTFFTYVAEEVRQILAHLGFRSLQEMIGKPGLIEPRRELQLAKTKTIDTSYLLDSLSCIPEEGENLCNLKMDRLWLKHGPVNSNGFTFDDRILFDGEVLQSIKEHGSVSRKYRITNIDRSSFARISGLLASKHGDHGFKGQLSFALTGAAGQSFCAFLGQGMSVRLHGYANDYVGKGMAGGKIVIQPPIQDLASCVECKIEGLHASQFSSVGNTCLYGATGGQLFVRGRGGERFAVRNSGSIGVIEGLGDHGCEYMTRGTIVNLGSIGRNFGAGMTGGLAFILADEKWMDVDLQSSDSTSENQSNLLDYINKETVTVQQLTPEHQAAKEYLRQLIQQHFDETGSSRAKFILEHLDEAISRFHVVVPKSEVNNPLLATSV